MGFSNGLDKNSIFMRISPQTLLVELMMCPESIAEQKKVVRAVKNEFEEAEEERAAMELEVMGEVTDEQDPVSGKPRYSNDKSRQAELSRRLKSIPSYTVLARHAKAIKSKLGQAQDELDRLENNYRSLRYRAELAAAELRFWAGEEPKETRYTAQATQTGINAQQAY